MLADYLKRASVAADRETWDKIGQKLRGGEMPPDDATERPTDSERSNMLAWVDQGLAATDCGSLPRDPGRVTIRRLNRNEYNNTIRDLVGLDFHPADDFPSDDVGYGFDNIGDVLSLPPILLEKYLAAVEAASPQLPDQPDETVDGGLIRKESYFNYVAPFYHLLWLYLFAGLIAIGAWLGWSRVLNRTAFALILFTFVLHTWALWERMLISGR